MTSDHLRARGERVEVLFAFRRQSAAALIPPHPGLFFSDVRLASDAAGLVRCRIAGEPAALLEVAPGLWLNVARLAALWPMCVSELAQRVGQANLAAFLDAPATVTPLEGDALKSYILEHQIHARDLHLLGENTIACVEPAYGPKFELRLPRGTLGLVYSAESYRRAHAAYKSSVQALESRPEVRWNGALIPLDVATPWLDAELAEALVAGSQWVDVDPNQGRLFLEAILESLESTGDAAIITELFNLLGVTLRRLGRLDEAVERFDRALAMALDDAARQGIFYNRGFTRLQRTMRQTVQTPAGLHQVALHASSFDLDERFRAAWEASRADFEEASRIDPDDAIARTQLHLSIQLLALLDQKRGPGGAPPAPRGKRADRSGDWAAWIMSAVLLGVLALVAHRWGHPSEEPQAPKRVAVPVVVTHDAGVDPWAVSEARRAKLFTARDAATLAPRLTEAPCPVPVSAPTPVPADEVIAPYLGRGLRGELYGRDHFDATLRHYFDLFAPGTEVLSIERGGIGPLSAPDRGGLPLFRSPVQLTLVVGAWRDPVFPPGSDSERYMRGEIRGRLIVWSHERSQVICAAEVEATNSAQLPIVRRTGAVERADDPLNRARVDLVEQAIRAAIPRLRAAATP